MHPHVRRRLLAVAVGAVGFLAFSCVSTGPVALDISPISGNAKPLPDPSSSVSVLPVCIAPVQEASVGVAYGRKILAPGMAQAVADALVDLSDSDITFLTFVAATPEAFAASEAPAKLTIVRAYLRSVYDSKSAVVVLRVESNLGVEHFRAQDTGLTYFTAGEEMSLALRKAFREALNQSRPHLAAIAAELSLEGGRAVGLD